MFIEIYYKSTLNSLKSVFNVFRRKPSLGGPGKKHLIPENTFIYLLQFNRQKLQVSDKYKGIAIRTVCKRVEDPIQDRPPSKRYSYHKN